MSDLTLRSTDDVENIKRKHTPKPWGYSSWQEYWCEKSGEEWPETCRFHGCRRSAHGSAHVIVNNDSSLVYIIPTCRNHYTPWFTKVFSVENDTCAVRIGEYETQAELANTFVNLLNYYFRTERPNNIVKLELKSGTKVKNVQGTADDEPPGSYDTWKEFYGNHYSWPPSCRILGCGGKNTGGAHVKISRKSGEWIIPMCAEHNHPTNTKWMPVNKGTGAVRVPDEE